MVLFDEAEQSGCDPNRCAAHRWQCWMLLGDFEQAWRESDSIDARDNRADCRLWDQRPFDGKRVIVRCLHGYGDAIQFIRYLPLLRSQASEIIVETHPEMVSLLKRTRGAGRVIGWEENPVAGRTDWDQQIEVMELPRAFRTTLQTVPHDVPYLHLAESPRRLHGGRSPRIGLIWAASSWNPHRSISLSQLAPLLQVDGLSFFGFQHGPAREQLRIVTGISDAADVSHTILDTANDFLEIDLLITVDTMAAHLAGALGKPVWVLLPFEADWRWMLERDDSPWYPTMRLFRQPRRDGDWTPVVDRLVAELSTMYR
jgi:hypothetical protein